eukprot:SAG11_NODE_37_length_21777_cov_4.523711_4_plen_174_part_00
MPLFGRGRSKNQADDDILLALDRLAVPQSISDELRCEHPARTSAHLVPHQHVDQDDHATLVRVSSAEKAVEKLSGKKRKARLVAHREAVLAFGAGDAGDATEASASLDTETISAVPDFGRLSTRTAAVAVSPRPEGYIGQSVPELRAMQADAAVAGMSRGRAVYFRGAPPLVF